MDIQTAYYHGIRQQVRRVLNALGPARVDKALTSFDDGESSWKDCFFARAYKGEADLNTVNFTLDEIELHHRFPRASAPEVRLMRLLDIHTVVPIRLVWHTFDSHSKLISKEDLRKFVRDVQDEQYAASADEFLKSIDFTVDVEETPMLVTCG